MKNYVLMYNISDNESRKSFQRELQNRFPMNNTVIENGFQYFSFAEKTLPGVTGNLKDVMDRLELIDNDYIALFYIREEEPDLINRLMLFGTSEQIEKDLQSVSNTLHQNVLTELMEIEFIKMR